MEIGIRKEELLSNEEYDRCRDERRRAIIALKKPRRVGVGPDITFIFETRETALYQIQEILRAEGITGEREIGEEIAVYDVMVPRAGELRATMMIEIPDREERMRRLPELVGIEDAVSLRIENESVRPSFHYWRETDERASPVNYAIFSLTEAQQEALRVPGIPVVLVVDHPKYQAEQPLSASSRESLARELVRPAT